MTNKSKRSDSAATIDELGNLSNVRLHEEMTEGVDEYEFQMQTRAKLLAQGVPVSAVDSVLPMRPQQTLMNGQHSCTVRSELPQADPNYGSQFRQRVMDEFLPQFCNHYGYDVKGFVSKTLDRITDYDAMWFLKALDTGVVTCDGAFFTALRSGAREQIFWQHEKSAAIRPLSLWAEPVITIGAAGRLHCEFGWPKDRVGLQSEKDWAFDLVAYDALGISRSNTLVVCEVKKQKSEIDYLVQAMQGYLSAAPLEEEPAVQKQRNAYKKVLALRKLRPKLVWILGPENYGKLFRLINIPDLPSIRLEAVEERELCWEQSAASN